MIAPDEWARDFIRRLVRNYGPSRATRYGELASLESQIEWPSENATACAHWRLHSEDRFLSRTAHDICALLLRTMTASAASASDKDNAALLYRRGIERGWWDGTPAKVEHVIATESTVRVKKLKRAPVQRTEAIDIKKTVAAIRDCDALLRVLTDPKADTGARHFAIRQFFDAMERAGRGDILRSALSTGSHQ
jgi:hypothetical protein